MSRMLRPRWIALLLVLSGLALAPSAIGLDKRPPESELLWLGPYFAGLRWNQEQEDPLDDRFVYGECILPEGEGGCGWPLEIQNATSCSVNPLRAGEAARRLFLLRGGGIAAEYSPAWVEVGTGLQTATVNPEEFELMGAALREIRHRSEPAPQPLAPPVYPLPVLRELKRVTVAASRLGGIKAVARATALSAIEVRLRLRVAELLGPDALADVPLPTMSTATRERLEQLAFHAEYRPAKRARRMGISLAELKKKIRRVRGLSGPC